MASALALARRGLGRVAPNPAVGCVLVKDGRVIGRGWTQDGGRPHAETEALRRAGQAARGATAYVTLEPCAHQGKTDPCVEALIDAGIKRAVIALEDPDPRVHGRGLAKLKEAGIEVVLGVGRDAAATLNQGFFLKVEKGRPLFTLKLATTLDGRIATHKGESHWITGEQARRRVHLLRAEHDAVLVGALTALVDNPMLTCRLPGLERATPLRIVLDGRMRLPLTHDLVSSAKSTATLLVTLPHAEHHRVEAYQEAGVDVIAVEPDKGGRPNALTLAKLLGKRGLTRVLIEGGATVAAAFLQAGLIDRLEWFRAATLIGGDGVPATAPFGVDHLADAPVFSRTGVIDLGADVLESFVRCP
ncbi:MAG: bifunctional diaminohydroxyphosphoribosylaminopyrimidine deaminase/5-amino-6-(5-phosphoribosylamino)uracil reductase RibD [Alphaproteobacteria bacterium]|nr:bifunctional diaminohydroxyphosphoribosylaminopyrimidine deaminase/5-amino-6-(5-phosphoribosylamino)uracil reductase RibD [Alphaproteobacteria bacterium]